MKRSWVLFNKIVWSMNTSKELFPWDDVDAWNTGHLSYSLSVSNIPRKLSTESSTNCISSNKTIQMNFVVQDFIQKLHLNYKEILFLLWLIVEVSHPNPIKIQLSSSFLFKPYIRTCRTPNSCQGYVYLIFIYLFDTLCFYSQIL